VRVAAYQAPLFTAGVDALDLVRTQVKRCESECVTILCCPEAILGGLALACIASCILRSAGLSIWPDMAFASSGSESSRSA
jgi:hypothetical protein